MKTKIFSGLVCLALLFAFAGCGKPGMLKELAGAKLGVTWEGSPSYSALVSREIKKRTRLRTLDDQNLPVLAGYRSPEGLAVIREQHVDYILVCSLAAVEPVQQASRFSAREGVKIRMDYKQKVKLAYRLLAVSSGEMLFSGISEGEGKRSVSVRVGHDGSLAASGWLFPKSDAKLLEEAIKDAVHKSELL
jgi:hypothetical protein